MLIKLTNRNSSAVLIVAVLINRASQNIELTCTSFFKIEGNVQDDQEKANNHLKIRTSFQWKTIFLSPILPLIQAQCIKISSMEKKLSYQSGYYKARNFS